MEKHYLEAYYEQYDEDGRLSRSRRGELEYLTTMGYIQAYLQPGQRVLEVGAGTGRYSLALAVLGAEMTAVEPVAHNLDILRGKMDPKHPVTALSGSAENLSMLEGESFDMTLLLGPMYHLGTKEERMQAMGGGGAGHQARRDYHGCLLYCRRIYFEVRFWTAACGGADWARCAGASWLYVPQSAGGYLCAAAEDGDRSDDAGLSCRTDALCGHRRAGVSDAGYAGTPD